MKSITITRTQRTTYATSVHLPEDEAEWLIQEFYRGRPSTSAYLKASELCPDEDQHWQESENVEFEVEETKDA